MAGREAARRGLAQEQALRSASRHHMGTAGVKPAAGRRRDQARHLAADRRRFDARRIGARHGVEQRLRVGVLRLGVELRLRRDLDDRAGVDHRDPMRDRRARRRGRAR